MFDESRLSAKKLKDLRIAALYLFGSQAQGVSTDASDYDFGILLENPEVLKDRQARKNLYDALLELLEEAIAKPADIDLVFLDEADNQLQYHAVRQGKVLWNWGPSKRFSFEEQVVEWHADFEPYRRMFERATWERLG